jgi:SpoIID/LytB domain protein
VATDLRSSLRRRAAGAVAVAALAGAAVVGAPVPAAQAAITGDIQFTGHGWGHGRGLGQWGAYGYAVNHGWSYQQILSHYYGGTVRASQPNGVITVNLGGQDGKDLVVTSGRDFVVGGVRVSAGSAARVTARPDGTFTMATSSGCTGPVVGTTSIPNSRVVPSVGNPGNDLQAMLSLCTPAGSTQYRGELSVVWAANAQHTVNTVWMEDYLRGVVPRESPASWGDGGGGKGIEALKAQAVAARSYAWAEGRTAHAKTCDTTSCQVYLGAGTNMRPLEDARTDAAIAATGGVVLRNSTGGVVRTEFSSSTGGWSAGGNFPAVPDDGDAASPHHDWSLAVPATTIADAFGVGTLTGIRVTARNGLGADGGRASQVEVAGTAKTVTVTGATVRTKLALKSDWFVIGSAPAPVVNPAGPAVFMAAPGGSGTAGAVAFGDPGDVPLVGDWNGDGVDTVGVFRAGVFFLGNGTGGQADLVFGFGQAGDQPVSGDWDGDGKDSVGVYRAGMVYLRNSLSTGVAQGQYAFGAPGDILVSGDWNGDGYDTTGVWRAGVFHLTNNNLRPTTDVQLSYGDVADLPAVGDWDGNGTDTVGVYRADAFLLRNDLKLGPAQQTVRFGNVGDRPIPGVWQPRTATAVGISRKY